MKIWSNNFKHGERVPAHLAFGKPHPDTHVELSDNKNPHLAWADLPPGTKSLVLICHDGDVPSRPEHVNQEGKTVPADLARVDFYHWIVVDLPPDAGPIAEGEFAAGITPKGKPGPAGPRGTRQGINDYTAWFSGDAAMGGNYFGYDGPCPPWNDERVHNYHFTLYALDVPRCPVEGEFRGPEVIEAMQGHILGKASLVGTYAICPHAK